MKRSLSLSKCFVFMLLTSLTGCGTVTPDIQESWGDNLQATARENDIVRLARCETGIAIKRIFREGAPVYFPEPGHPVPKWDLGWFDNWGIQVALTLTVIENTALNPGISLNKVLSNSVTKFSSGNVTTPQSSALAFGGSFSTNATRTDVLHLFYKVADLHSAYFKQDDLGNFETCPMSMANATLFSEDNFKIYEWLSSVIFLQGSEVADFKKNSLGQQGQNGISHEVKFEIVTNGNATPSWKLVDITANSGSSPLFGIGRDRIQDLIITIGPLEAGKSGPQLSASAQNLQLAQEIGFYVAQGIRNSQ